MTTYRERSFRTPALILKRRDIGEADRLLTVLTPQRGKLDVIAKGARKLNSTKTGHVELFTRADMLIHRGRDLGIVVQAELSAPFLRLRDDLLLGASAAYCVELVDRFVTIGDEDTAGVFALLDATLARLCSVTDTRLIVRFYELHLLDWVGFRPELTECVIGHEAIVPEDQFFSTAEGGVVCPRHAGRAASLTPISMLALKLLRNLQRNRFEQITALDVAPAIHNDAERVMGQYLAYVLERRLDTADLLRRLRRD